MSTLVHAIKLACEAHEHQKDKAGETYILHPLRVMLSLDDEEARIAAVLHDVLEDSPYSLERLRDEGFSEIVLDALKCLTKEKGEDYGSFIDRVKTNRLAIRVKLADLKDNMNVFRLTELTKEDSYRLEKYHKAWKELSALNQA